MQIEIRDSATAETIRRQWDSGIELRRLEGQGLHAAPSDAQQMILEMVPEALWEVTRVIEEVDTIHGRPNTVTIESQVTVVRLVDDDTDMVIDVLNTERKVEQLPR